MLIYLNLKVNQICCVLSGKFTLETNALMWIGQINLNMTDLEPDKSVLWRGCLDYDRRFSSILGFYPLNVTTGNKVRRCLQVLPVSSGGAKSP